MSDLRDHVARLIDAGWAVVPIASGEKGARDAGWLAAARAKRYTVDDFGEPTNVGVVPGAPSGDRVDVDLDAREAVAAGNRLLPLTELVHGRASKPRSHHWFHVPGAKARQFKDPVDNAVLLEIRADNGQTVVPPSVHPSGEPIVWEVERAPLSLELPTFERGVALVAVASLLAKHWPRGRSNRHGLALVAAGFLGRYIDDDKELEELFRVVFEVAGDDEVDSRLTAVRDTLTKLRSEGAKVTGGPRFRDEFPNGAKVAGRILEWIGAAGEELVDEWNARHFVIRVGKNKRETVVGHDAEFPPSFESFASFRNFNTNAGVVGKKPAAVAWLEHPRRRTYTGELIFAPPPIRARDGVDYNLWRGFGVEPDPEPNPELRCARFLAHALDVVCDGNRDHYEFLLDVLAFKVQNPGRISEVVVVLQGGQGVGKGTFVEEYGLLFGRRHYTQIDKPEQVLGKFNAILTSKLVVFMDEAFWAGDKASIGALKRLATEKTLVIERKGIDPGEEPNFAQLFVATNEKWSWPADLDDRRGFVLKVSGRFAKNDDYFTPLRTEMNSGGRGALLAFLLGRTITHNLRRIPRTAALGEQQDLSLDPVARWWKAKLERGHTWDEDDVWVDWISTKDAHDDYVATLRRGERPLLLDAFVKEWKRLLPDPSVATQKKRGVIDRVRELEARRAGRSLTAADSVRRHGFPIRSLALCRRAFDHVAGVEHDWQQVENADLVVLPFETDPNIAAEIDRMIGREIRARTRVELTRRRGAGGAQFELRLSRNPDHRRTGDPDRDKR